MNSKNTSTAINFWFRAPDLGQNIFEHIPLVMPVMKVNLCRNVEKLAVTELKVYAEQLYFLSTGMIYLPKWSKMLLKISHQG